FNSVPSMIMDMGTPPRHAAASAACTRVAELLAQARRPLLVLGNGARSAHRELLELAERLSLAVIVTGHGKGAFPERHPLYVGIMGLGQHPSVPEHLAETPDVTLIVGSRLNDLATNGWALDLNGSLATIQIDRDPTLVGRNAQVTHALIGDAQLTVQRIVDALPDRSDRPGQRIVRRRPLPQRATAAPDEDAEPSTASATIAPRDLLHELQRQLPDARWVADIGEHLAHALHLLSVDRPDQFTVMLGYGSMGSGVCSSIGIKLAEPDMPVVCICGDGGFTSYLGELMSCVENDIGVVFVVFNDGRWNMVEHGFEAVYGARPVPLINAIADLAGVAQCMGVRSATVRSVAELRQLDLAAQARQSSPLVIDVRIDPDHALTRETRSASLKHFHGNHDHDDNR
ncbi:MAG: thiamine pyrophosphate-dependent enzyme, partial [Myxococcota bacterium]